MIKAVEVSIWPLKGGKIDKKVRIERGLCIKVTLLISYFLIFLMGV